MNTFNHRELKRLLAEGPGPCVSIYMTAYAPGSDGPQNPIRLKNLLQQAHNQLVALGSSAPQARSLLKPANQLTSDPHFWQRRTGGLALFVAPDRLYRFDFSTSTEEVAKVGTRFYLKPLLAELALDDRYYVLALSRNKVRLFKGSRQGLAEVPGVGLPQGMVEALNYDQPQEHAQAHSAMRGALGKQAAVFHGQGGASESVKTEVRSYLRLVDAAVCDALHDEPLPLIVASVQSLFAVYRELSNYRRLVKQPAACNPDYLSPSELFERTWPLARPYAEEARRAAADRCHHLAGSEATSEKIETIVPAAREGKIDTLFLVEGTQRWGTFDAESHRVQVHEQPEPKDEDLVELAVIETLSRRGAVYVVPPEEAPGGAEVAALFRY